jgi:hypothetical protein
VRHIYDYHQILTNFLHKNALNWLSRLYCEWCASAQLAHLRCSLCLLIINNGWRKKIWTFSLVVVVFFFSGIIINWQIVEFITVKNSQNFMQSARKKNHHRMLPLIANSFFLSMPKHYLIIQMHFFLWEAEAKETSKSISINCLRQLFHVMHRWEREHLTVIKAHWNESRSEN